MSSSLSPAIAAAAGRPGAGERYAGKGKGKGGPRGAGKLYLLAYNVASCLAWAAVLQRVVAHMVAGRLGYGELISRATTVHADAGGLTRWVQTGALLEVVHVLLGLVRSSLGTTGMQVSSRIWMVWVICWFFPEVATSPFYASMVFAWSTTEVIRYAHYAAGLAEVSLGFLEWLRYSTFYVLYPVGAGSEALVMYASAPYAKAQFGELGMLVIGGLVLIWPLGLLMMMIHMHKQRSKYLGKGKRNPKGKKQA